jgi:hypothetical protein
MELGERRKGKENNRASVYRITCERREYKDEY